jgi:hypothetical protein
MATYERLDYGSDDGSQWGTASTDKLGVYGATPVAKTVVGNITSVTEITSAAGAAVVSTLVQQLKTYGWI